MTEFFIGFILLLAGVTLLTFVSKGHKDIKENAKQTMLLPFVWALVFLLSTFLLILIDFLDHNDFWVLIGHQVLILILGVVYIYTVYKYLPWIQKELHLFELLLVFSVPLIVAGLQIIVLPKLPFLEESNVLNFIPAFIFFMVPTLAVKSFVYLLKIPDPVVEYKTWEYPVYDEIEPPSHEMPDIVPLNIAVAKKEDDKELVVIRANAPVQMNFGDFFYFLLQDYNLKDAAHPIYFANQYDTPYKWHFNFEPKWYQTTRVVDPSATIQENRIKENQKIICNRLLD